MSYVYYKYYNTHILYIYIITHDQIIITHDQIIDNHPYSSELCSFDNHATSDNNHQRRIEWAIPIPIIPASQHLEFEGSPSTSPAHEEGSKELDRVGSPRKPGSVWFSMV